MYVLVAADREYPIRPGSLVRISSDADTDARVPEGAATLMVGTSGPVLANGGTTAVFCNKLFVAPGESVKAPVGCEIEIGGIRFEMRLAKHAVRKPLLPIVVFMAVVAAALLAGGGKPRQTFDVGPELARRFPRVSRLLARAEVATAQGDCDTATQLRDEAWQAILMLVSSRVEDDELARIIDYVATRVHRKCDH